MLPTLLLTILVARADDAAKGPTPMQAGLRFKEMSLPSGVLSTWLVTDETSPIPNPPKIAAWAAGAEFSIQRPTEQWTFYLERYKFKIADGYWDDVDDPAVDNDGEWLEPSSGFGMVAVGANTGTEWAVTHKQKKVWLGFGLSGGLGVGIMTGHVTRWYSGTNIVSDTVTDASCGGDDAAYDRRTEGCGDDGELKLPPVLPLLDFNASFALHIADHAYVRLEGGLHDLPYYGGAVGGQF